MSEEEKSISTQPDSTTSTSSYRSIFKATSLFGGVQVFLIIIQIIRSKIIAALLGPTGFGIQGLFTSATLFVRSLSSMGLSQSAVKDVSEATSSGEKEKAEYILGVVNKLVIYTGLLGLIIVAVFSPILSKTSFGNYEYVLSFVLLSTTLLFDQLYDGKRVILQGTRQLKKLAKVSIYSATGALILTIPLYYFFGVDGIVPALIANSILAYLIICKLSKSTDYSVSKVKFKEALKSGGTILKMGIAMSFSGIFSTACAYLLRSYIRYIDGTEAVGLYMAGFVIINTYVGLVFSAITTDFYPRLASVSRDNSKSCDVINSQGELGIIILGPLLSICVLIMPLLIKILYTSEFMPAYDFILLATVGMIFRLVSVLIAFLFIVKGSTKLYICNELVTGVYMLALNVIGYKLGGLTGLGLSYTIGYLLYIMQVYYLTNRRYSYHFTKQYMMIILKYSLLIIISIMLLMLIATTYSRIIGGLICIISLLFAYKDLNERIQLKEVLVSYLKKNRK